MSLIRLTLGWTGEDWQFADPLDDLEYDDGAGAASGPGMTIGAALPLHESGRVPVAVPGDGDLMMGA